MSLAIGVVVCGGFAAPARASVTYAVAGTEIAINGSAADGTQMATYSTSSNGAFPFSEAMNLSATILGDETADSSATFSIGSSSGDTIFSLLASAGVPSNSTPDGGLPFANAGAFVVSSLGNGCNCGGNQPSIPVTQFTIDSSTNFTITGSFSSGGNAVSQISAILSAGTTLGVDNVFGYSNLAGSDNQTNGYSYSGTLAPGTYSYGALYGLNNANIADPNGSIDTGSIVFTLDTAAVPEPSYALLLGLGCAALVFARRNRNQPS
jgi:hypothetical protein